MVALVLATVFLEALMPMTTIARGGVSSVMQPRQVVVRDAGEWDTLWREHAGPDSPAPVVDFGSQMVVGVFLGSRNTGGYAVEITKVEQAGGAIVVHYTETKPERGMVLAQVITSPFHLVKVPRADGAVQFEKAGAPAGRYLPSSFGNSFTVFTSIPPFACENWKLFW